MSTSRKIIGSILLWLTMIGWIVLFMTADSIPMLYSIILFFSMIIITWATSVIIRSIENLKDCIPFYRKLYGKEDNNG